MRASELFSLAVAQAIILTVLACSFYRLARSLTGDARLASLALILAPISPTVLRFQPLMSAALSLTFIFFALPSFHEYEERKERLKFFLGAGPLGLLGLD